MLVLVPTDKYSSCPHQGAFFSPTTIVATTEINKRTKCRECVAVWWPATTVISTKHLLYSTQGTSQKGMKRLSDPEIQSMSPRHEGILHP